MTELERKVDVQNHPFWWLHFMNRFKINYLITTTANLTNINKLFSSKLSDLCFSFCNGLLFTNIFCRFSGIFIEKTIFEEFVEICEKNS